jgi:hypothetical protein
MMTHFVFDFTEGDKDQKHLILIKLSTDFEVVRDPRRQT